MKTEHHLDTQRLGKGNDTGQALKFRSRTSVKAAPTLRDQPEPVRAEVRWQGNSKSQPSGLALGERTVQQDSREDPVWGTMEGGGHGLYRVACLGVGEAGFPRHFRRWF